MPKAILADGNSLFVGSAEFELMTCLVIMGFRAPSIMAMSRKSIELGLDVEDTGAHRVVKTLEKKALVTTAFGIREGSRTREVKLTDLGLRTQIQIARNYSTAIEQSMRLLRAVQAEQKKAKEEGL